MRVINLRKWFSKTDKGVVGQKRQRQIRADFIATLKQVPCKDCGRDFQPEVMEFDHVPGRGGKISVVSARKSVRAILAEARKCDVVCANCHRARTAERRRSLRSANLERERQISRFALEVQRERENNA